MKTNPNRTGAERLSAEERREAIIDAAVTEFATMGFHGASTERIAAAAGISQPYIFRLFGTKKDLFVATVGRINAAIKETLQAAVAADPDNPLAAASAAFNQLMHRRDEVTLLLQAFATARDPELVVLTHARMGEMYAFIEEMTGKSGKELQQFFAYGMLYVIAATLDLPAIASEQPWAANLIQPWP
jgi:TetR/AcrR family transcriptional regulator